MLDNDLRNHLNQVRNKQAVHVNVGTPREQREALYINLVAENQRKVVWAIGPTIDRGDTPIVEIQRLINLLMCQ